MKRVPEKKRERSARTGNRVKSKAASVATGKKPRAGTARLATTSGLLAEMEQQRDLLETQIEELGKAHAALEISHQRFSELHEQAPVGYLTFDAQGCIRAINTEAIRLLGIARHSLIGKPFVVYVERADRKKFLEHLWRIRRTPTRVAADLRLVTADGTVRHVHMTTDRHHDAEGRSSLFLSAIDDVTELRAASASNAHLSAIVEYSPDAIFSITRDGLFRSWNPGAGRLFGYSKDEILGKHVLILVPEDRIEESVGIPKKVISGEHVSPFETVCLRKDGTPVDVEVSLSSITEGSDVTAMTAVMRDITERKQAAERLRKKAELLSLAQEGARMGIFEWDLVANQALWMPEMEELMGMKLEAMPDNLKPWFAQIHAEDAARMEESFLAWIGSNLRDVTEHYRFFSKGGERWFELRGRITRAPDGTALTMIGTNLDITARKLAEKKLEESERRERERATALKTQLAALMDTVPTAVLIAQDPFCLHIAGNRAAEELLRIPEGAEISLTAPARQRPSHYRVMKDGRKLKNSQMPAQMAARGIPVQDFEFSLVFDDGTSRDMLAYATPLRDGEGRERGSITVLVDITDRKQAEAALRESQQRLAGIVGSAMDAIVSTDSDRRILLFNAAAERMFRCSADEALGTPFDRFIPMRFRAAHEGRHRQFSETGETSRVMGNLGPVSGLRADGEEFPVEASISQIEVGGGQIFTVILRDVTERKRLEQEVLEISEIERQRIGQDLHDDLGQQLAGLWFFSATIEKNLRAECSAQADSAARIAAQLDKALALTRSLARGLQPVAAEPGGLMAALRELAERSAEMFKLRCRLECRRPVAVHDPAAATHLYRIAQEAVTNAARHGHAKRISILLASSEKNLMLTVNDDGSGVQKPAHTHTGMGIRTMKYRAEALGGSLIFSNRPQGGTSVVCIIPKPAEPSPKKH